MKTKKRIPPEGGTSLTAQNPHSPKPKPLNYLLYLRKSREEEDRQVLSIESQRDELLARFQQGQRLRIVGILEESRSAKTPGRPVFDKMLRQIKQGKVQGIIAWHPDRLARNSVDGGQIIYLLDQGVLLDLKFAAYTFENTPEGKMFLGMILAQTKHYSDKLSVDVKRGIRKKLALGWLPRLAPIGYLNHLAGSHEAVVIPDPDRFKLVKRLWVMVGQGVPVSKVYQLATEKWKLTTVQRRKSGGNPLSRAGVYRLLADPFYCGLIRHKGRLYPGSHRPMISVETFQRVQKLLGRELRTQAKKHEFAFTGLIRCDECGGAITASAKVNRYGSRYTYYHCTKRKGRQCSQAFVRLEEVERQILSILDRIKISDRYCQWALRVLRRKQTEDAALDQQIRRNHQQALKSCERELDNLVTLRLRGLIDDSEFAKHQRRLALEGKKLRDKLARPGALASKRLELSEMVFLFVNQAQKRFQDGSLRQKRQILKTIGWNFRLRDKKLLIEVKKPFRFFTEGPSSLTWSGLVDAVRTFCGKGEENLEDLESDLLATTKASELLSF